MAGLPEPHPLAWFIIFGIELLGWLVVGTEISNGLLLIGNVVLIVLFSSRATWSRLVKYLVLTGLWGITMYLLIDSSPDTSPGRRFIGAWEKTVRWLFVFSVPLCLGAVIDRDSFVKILFKWRCPLAVCRMVGQVGAFLAELTKSSEDALALHELAGRSRQSLRQRYILLGDIVTSSVFRLLVLNEESQLAVESRLGIGRGTVSLVNTTPFSVRDGLFCCVCAVVVTISLIVGFILHK